jgi:hypothetical protein
MLPFGFHPGFLIVLLVVVVPLLAVLVAGAFAAGWAFRMGWEKGGPRTGRDAAPE